MLHLFDLDDAITVKLKPMEIKTLRLHVKERV